MRFKLPALPVTEVYGRLKWLIAKKKKNLNKTNEQKHLLGKVCFSLTTTFEAIAAVFLRRLRKRPAVWGRALPRLRRPRCRGAASGPGPPWPGAAAPESRPRCLQRDPPERSALGLPGALLASCFPPPSSSCFP